MHEILDAWGNYYVIVGSSAAALTGLQFVVITLVGQTGRARGETLSAFATPNVIHFCSALLVSSILSMPWRGPWTPGLALVVTGILGDLYALVVMIRAHRQRPYYQPVFEDWLWHTILPAVAYTMVLVGGALLPRSTGVLFVIAPATLLLVFIGIHNAWDTVTFLITGGAERLGGPSATGSAPSQAPTAAPGAAPRDGGPAGPVTPRGD
jgi:hypothetical protein